MSTPGDIVLIEDDSIMREALAEWLRGAGYSVRTAEDATAGLAAVGVSAPALVVTDMHMPGPSGSVVITELKQRVPPIPVIAISALFNSGHGMSAAAVLALGAVRALAKPFKPGELLTAVAEIIGPPQT